MSDEAAHEAQRVHERSFGSAIEALKAGKRVSRAGWNGKGMHLYLEDWLEGTLRFATGIGPRDRKYEPCIVMFTATGTHQPGWLASQADILANDWGVVD